MEKIRFDYRRLRGRIIEKYGTYTAFAAAVGLKKSNLSAKLSNSIRITFEEIIYWSSPNRLDIPPAEIHAYFLCPEVR